MQSAKYPRDYPGTLAKLIEDKANGSAAIQILCYELSGILPVNPEGDKIARAAAVSRLPRSQVRMDGIDGVSAKPMRASPTWPQHRHEAIPVSPRRRILRTSS
jgi:hypothetical protein